MNGIGGLSILHIITRLDRGGSADVVLELARMEKAHGARVGIGVGKTDDVSENLDSFSARSGVEIYHLKSLERSVTPLGDLRALLETFSLIRRFKPDIVHTHTSKAGIIGRFAAKISGVGNIVHTPHGHIFYGYYGTLATELFVLLERLAAKVTDRITVLTENGRRDHIEKKIAPPSRFTVIPSGVDIRRFESGDGSRLRSELGLGRELVVGWVGRLVPIKDCATFIKAAAIVGEALPGVRFVVAGDGEEREALEMLRDGAGLKDRLVFLGNRSDIPDVMAAFDVFVLSSLNEGFGRVLVEAMASGAAIVSTEVGGTVDVIEDGVSGLLVPPGDHCTLADAVLRLLGDEGLRVSIVQAGRERSQRFDISETVKSFEDLYEEIMSH